MQCNNFYYIHRIMQQSPSLVLEHFYASIRNSLPISSPFQFLPNPHLPFPRQPLIYFPNSSSLNTAPLASFQAFVALTAKRETYAGCQPALHLHSLPDPLRSDFCPQHSTESTFWTITLRPKAVLLCTS